MTHTLRTLAPADEAAVHALWAICFDAPYLPALHALDPDRHRRTFVAARGDTVDAVVCYVPRQFRDADGRVERVGGIGNVAARPEARGQGLVRRLLTLAAEAVIAESCAWSLLFTATPGVYERSGWTGFRTSWAEGSLTTAGRFRVRAATPADARRPAELHAGFNATRPLTAVRTANDWIPPCARLVRPRRRMADRRGQPGDGGRLHRDPAHRRGRRGPRVRGDGRCTGGPR